MTGSGGIPASALKDPSNILSKRSVYFDFDSNAVKDEYRGLVQAHSRYMTDKGDSRIRIEGNCDERGSREYNLGLGERRGNAVSSSLGSAGASSSQLNVVSYGEERPVCKDHSEGCWQKNRRVEIVYTAKQ